MKVALSVAESGSQKVGTSAVAKVVQKADLMAVSWAALWAAL